LRPREGARVDVGDPEPRQPPSDTVRLLTALVRELPAGKATVDAPLGVVDRPVADEVDASLL